MKGDTTSLCFIFGIIVLTNEKVSAQAVCVSNKDNQLKRYDRMTHICKNGTIQLIDSTIKPERHESIPDSRRHEANPDRIRHDTNRRPARDTRRRTCGYDKYTPKTHTCCVQMVYQSKIHEGAQSSHVCCELKAYRRGFKDLPCNHPSMNDPLFKPKNLKRYGKTKTFCTDQRFRFSLEFKQRYMSSTFRHYCATLTSLDSPFAASKQVKVAIDEFSPRKSLDGKTLLIISTHDFFLDKNLDFYLRSSDKVYTGTCNARTLFKRLTKGKRRKCKTVKRQSLI